MPANAPASVVLLAGGASSRMGVAKALLDIGGESLALRAVHFARSLSDDVVVAAGRHAPLPDVVGPGVRLVEDERPLQGPAAGLLYGLRAARHDRALATACDQPFPSAALAAELLSRLSGDFDAVVPVWRGREQPLFAAVARTLVPLLESALAAGELSLVAVLRGARVWRLEEREVVRIDPEGESFLDVDTREDYERALALASRKGLFRRRG